MEKHTLGARRQHRSRGGRFSGAASLALATLFAFGAAATSHATPYWIAWEGDDWPENQGWEHVAFNYFGGPLAVRSLHGSWMTIDGMASIGIGDGCEMSRPAALDPHAGEDFVVQWRLRVHELIGTGLDPSVVLRSDDGYGVSFRFGLTSVALPLEGYVSYPLAGGMPHAFELRSSDMHDYELFVDGSHLRSGVFTSVVTRSFVAWGDGGIGSASRSEWDYFRFGVVPEPSALITVTLTLIGIVLHRGHREREKHRTEGAEPRGFARPVIIRRRSFTHDT